MIFRVIVPILFVLSVGFCGELEELLAKHYEAVGGVEKLEDIRSMEINGSIFRNARGNQLEIPVKMIYKGRNKVRVENTRRDMVMVRAYDGEKGWMINPFRGGSDPQGMGENQAKALRLQADFLGDLVGWKKKGLKLELVGKKDVEGTETYQIKVTADDGKVRNHYLDSEYFVLIKTETTNFFRGNEMESNVFYSDYKEVDGLMRCHAMEVKGPDGRTRMSYRFTKIEINPEVDDALFEKPES